jgi:PAS domain S-box-containing protein
MDQLKEKWREANKALEQAHHQAEELQLLYDLSQKIGYTLNYDELFRLMLAHLHQIVPHDVAAGILITSHYCELFIRPIRPLTMAVEKEIQTRILNTFQRMAGESSYFDPHRLRILELVTPDTSQPAVTSLGSAFQVPLIIGDHHHDVVGVLFVGAEQVNAFTEDQVRLLYTVAGQAAISIERLRALLAAEQEQLENLVESLPEGVLLLDEERHIVLANPVARNYLALLTDAGVGDTLTQLGERPLEALLLPPASPEKTGHQVATKGSSPTRRIFEVTTQMTIARPQGKGWTLIIRDVTQQKKAEEALRESEQRYKRLLGSVTDYVYTVKIENGRPISTVHGENCVAVTGYTSQEYEADPFLWYRMVYQDDRPTVLEQPSRLLAEESIPALEHRIIHKDGSIRWVRHTAVLRKNEEGQVIAYDGLITDITERKQVEELLKRYRDHLEELVEERTIELETANQQLQREVNERKRVEETMRKLSRAVEQSPSIVLITDPEGIIEYVNPKFTQVTGYAEDRVIGKNPRFLKSGQTPPEEYARLWNTIKSGRDWQGEFQNRKRSGQLYWAFASISPITNEAGEITHFLAVQEDITQRKQLEEQLRQSQKMEAVGRLAGGVAHDFNNLLMVITGHCNLILDSLIAGDPIRRDVEEIYKAGDKAASLTRQLLAFSRRLVLQPRILSLNSVVADMEKMLKRLIGEDVELETNLDPTLEFVKADPGQMEQVLMNLVVNARDAMPNGGKLTVETANVYLDEDFVSHHVDLEAGQYVLLAVSDTGGGIPSQIMPHIFEPFFTTKAPGKGTGLGLSTVFGIVTQSGGHILVDSQLKQGTTFKIYLPQIEQEQSTTKPAQAHSGPPPGSETILLVEDEEGVRFVARRLLQKSGYTVLEARDGNEALRVCEQHPSPIHLLITDVVMPGGLNGRELAERVVTLHPEIKVLYISGYTNDAVLHLGVLEDSKAFLQKPFTIDDLAHKVRGLLDDVSGAR